MLGVYFRLKESWTNLVETKEKNDRSAFNQLMLEAIPELRKYITSRLRISIKKSKLPKGKYRVDDFIDDLFIGAYDRIGEFQSYKEFGNWLYTEVDKLMEDAIIEEEFDDFFFENIDRYERAEWDTMEEDYYMDEGGDLILEDELTDPSYPDHNYVLKDVFVDSDQDKFIERLSQKLNKEAIDRHLQFMLSNLPVNERSLFQLSVSGGLADEDIAKIKGVQVTEVNRVLKDVRNKLVKSFHARYEQEL